MKILLVALLLSASSIAATAKWKSDSIDGGTAHVGKPYFFDLGDYIEVDGTMALSCVPLTESTWLTVDGICETYGTPGPGDGHVSVRVRIDPSRGGDPLETTFHVVVK